MSFSMNALKTIPMPSLLQREQVEMELCRDRERWGERDGTAGRTVQITGAKKERKDKEHSRGTEKREEGLCLPRRACFILGLSMVTVAVLLPLTET